MIFFPIGTDRRLKHTPWVNYLLIALNISIFMITHQQLNNPRVYQFFLHPDGVSMRLYQFISYQFLHADMMHLLGNMVFLYVFGNSVEDRFGKIGYLGFYLAGGVMAGLGHALVETAPVIGASGAVAAMTGAFLALFPLTDIKIFYWIFLLVDTFWISSIILIIFQVIMDAFFWSVGTGGTAYLAHLTGYGFGFAVGMGLLATRLLAREPYDLLALIQQKRRRAKFRKLTQQGFQPWEAHPVTGTPGKKGKTNPLTPEQEAIMAERAMINQAMAEHRQEEAAKRYITLLAEHPEQVMSQQTQLDIANQLMASGNYTIAAQAYELFLKQYPKYPQLPSIELILGLIYARYLKQPQRAQTLLTDARPILLGDDAKLAEEVLAEIKQP